MYNTVIREIQSCTTYLLVKTTMLPKHWLLKLLALKPFAGYYFFYGGCAKLKIMAWFGEM